MNAATPTISTDADAPRRPVDPSAAVIELARTAARQDAGDPALIGDFAGAGSEDDVAITVRFATTDVAYTGWAWCVTVALVDPERPTISEVVLLPGPDSLLPPAWLPWSERIRPGDLGPGDLLLPPTEEDPRLVPAYVESDDPAVEDVAHELGIGRVRVMSRAGRTDTAERWFDGGFGPTADMAKQAPLHCVVCAFFLPLAGSLGARFGACGNEMSPADGRVVDADYGCGAHSELVIEPVPTGFRPSHIDDTVLDVHPRGLAESAAAFLGEDDSELEIRPTHDVPGAAGEAPVEVVVSEVGAATVEVPDAAASDAPAEDVPGDPVTVDLAAVDVAAGDDAVEQVGVDQVAFELEDAPVDTLDVVGVPAAVDADEAPALEDAPVEEREEPVALDDAPTLEESPVEVEVEVEVEAPAPGDADA